jgi:Protein of unknown function (DUF3616)
MVRQNDHSAARRGGPAPARRSPTRPNPPLLARTRTRTHMLPKRGRPAMTHTPGPRRPARGAALAAACLAAATALTATAGPAAATTFHAAATASVTAFTPGDLVVYRVGTGSGSLSSSATAVFLDEYSPSGSLVESVPMPTATSGSVHAFTDSGTAASDGELTLSPGGAYLAAAGYTAATGTSNVAGTDAVTVARISAAAAVDTSTTLPSFADGNNVRSAVTSDGNTFWVSGAAGGIAATTLGSSSATALNTSDTNFRQLEIQGGRLYASSNKNSLTVASVGSGLPTTGGQSIVNLPGNPDSGGDPYAFVLFNLSGGSGWDTLYVADDSAGKVEKYVLSGSSWKSAGSASVSDVTGLTGTLVGGKPTLYATGSGSSGTSGTLTEIVDSAAAGANFSSTKTTLASASSKEAFRGVAFAPGTSVVTQASAPPTISAAAANLPGADGLATDPTDAVTVGDTAYGAAAVNVTATSSNTAVVANSGLTVTGSGAARTLTVAPTGVGYATITLTASAPDGTSATATVDYAASAALPDPAASAYYSGAGNASTAVDLGDGYMLVGDDESNVLRLYREGVSGPPVKTFDFTSLLPDGTTEIDIEAAAMAGDRIYWTGSMSNSSSGNLEPARSTLFATDVSGTGADTTLTYVGSYTGLRSDLIAWDQDNGSGLGSNYLGFAASAASGVDGHEPNAFNVEGLEFAPGSTTTAYLAFRGPLESPSTRTQALIVPLTNINALVTDGNPGTVHATFGAPIQMSLQGLGIRELRKNAADQYLLIAGTADDTNSSFLLYSWDGAPADAPVLTGTTLPAGAADGSWETIVSVPGPLASGDPVQVVQDNGDTVWYGDGLTSKTGILQDFQKDLGMTVSYTP